MGGTRSREGNSHHALADLTPSINSLSANQCVNINGLAWTVGGGSSRAGEGSRGDRPAGGGKGRQDTGQDRGTGDSSHPGSPAVPAAAQLPGRQDVFCFDAVRRSLMNRLSGHQSPTGGTHSASPSRSLVSTAESGRDFILFVGKKWVDRRKTKAVFWHASSHILVTCESETISLVVS